MSRFYVISMTVVKRSCRQALLGCLAEHARVRVGSEGEQTPEPAEGPPAMLPPGMNSIQSE